MKTSSQESSKPYTTAVFEVDDANGERRIYHGCASFDRDKGFHPWYIWLVLDNEWYRDLGYFSSIHEGWARAIAFLGIPIESPVMRREGEGTDGGPFGGNDKTHER